jgi:hypothetical protein
LQKLLGCCNAENRRLLKPHNYLIWFKLYFISARYGICIAWPTTNKREEYVTSYLISSYPGFLNGEIIAAA